MAITGGAVEAFGSKHPRLTMTGASAITAGRLVEYSGDRTVQHAGDKSAKVAGVAMQTYDGTAGTGAKLAVATGGVWYLVASGAITAGQSVVAAAAGKVRAYNAGGGDTPDEIVGKATEAIADTVAGRVELRLN